MTATAPTDAAALREARVGESGREMRIMLSTSMEIRRMRGERFVRVDELPWELFCDAAERTSQENHGQSLSRISERGGFDAVEALCVLTSMKWEQGKSISEEQAHRILYMMRSLYRRGVLAARATTDADLAKAREEIAGLEAALERIVDMEPATTEITLAHEMAQEAREALTSEPAHAR